MQMHQNPVQEEDPSSLDQGVKCLASSFHASGIVWHQARLTCPCVCVLGMQEPRNTA